MAKTVAEIEREIRAFVATQKKRGGSYRDDAGNYDPKLYEEHNRLVGEREGLKRAAKATAKMARQAKSWERRRDTHWWVSSGDGKIIYIASKKGDAGQRQASYYARSRGDGFVMPPLGKS